MPDVQTLAAKYAAMQHKAVLRADDNALRRHIADTLKRCLPPQLITAEVTDNCFHAVQLLPDAADPMHTGAIHAWAGVYLQTAADTDHPLLQRLHHAALRLLPESSSATRDDLRLITLDALYKPGLLPPGTHLAFLKHRLGLNGSPRLSCEEIAVRIHHPLTRIHELEAAIITTLSLHGGSYA
ncbi:MAG: hypothetical protein IJA83_12780 [Clostridia bacterium]|nr:hypothetical protein [Clostridia bacterium]